MDDNNGIEMQKARNRQELQAIVHQKGYTPGQNNNQSQNNNDETLYNPDDDDPEEIYIVRQNTAYFSYIFSFLQIFILAWMMWQCSVAPLTINPMFGPYPDALSEWGAKNAVLILEDQEYWRLITPIMLHAGVLHLLANVLVQLEAGAFFEKEWGSVRWIVVYLGSALASSILSVIVQPDAISVGSSGAVMGLFGGKLSEVILKCGAKEESEEERTNAKVRKEQCLAVSCSVITVMAFSFVPYVDWAAHLGGLVGGLAVGCVIFATELEYKSCRIFWVVAGIIITAGCYAAAVYYMSFSGEVEVDEELRDVCGYYQKQFEDYECHCMKEEYVENMKEDDGEDGARFFL